METRTVVCNVSEEIVITAERIARLVFHGAMDANQVRLLMKAGWPIYELPTGELACVPKVVSEHARRVGYDPSHPERATRPARAGRTAEQRAEQLVPVRARRGES